MPRVAPLAFVAALASGCPPVEDGRCTDKADCADGQRCDPNGRCQDRVGHEGEGEGEGDACLPELPAIATTDWLLNGWTRAGASIRLGDDSCSGNVVGVARTLTNIPSCEHAAVSVNVSECDNCSIAVQVGTQLFDGADAITSTGVSSYCLGADAAGTVPIAVWGTFEFSDLTCGATVASVELVDDPTCTRPGVINNPSFANDSGWTTSSQGAPAPVLNEKLTMTASSGECGTSTVSQRVSLPAEGNARLRVAGTMSAAVPFAVTFRGAPILALDRLSGEASACIPPALRGHRGALAIVIGGESTTCNGAETLELTNISFGTDNTCIGDALGDASFDLAAVDPVGTPWRTSASVDNGTASLVFSDAVVTTAVFTIDPTSCGYLSLSQPARFPVHPALQLVAISLVETDALPFYEIDAFPFINTLGPLLAGSPGGLTCVGADLAGITASLQIRIGDEGGCGETQLFIDEVRVLSDASCP